VVNPFDRIVKRYGTRQAASIALGISYDMLTRYILCRGVGLSLEMWQALTRIGEDPARISKQYQAHRAQKARMTTTEEVSAP
jgi:hypothetical protein